MTPEYLAERFDISLGAAKIRLKEIEKIKRKQSGIGRQLPESVVRYLTDAKSKGLMIIDRRYDR